VQKHFSSGYGPLVITIADGALELSVRSSWAGCWALPVPVALSRLRQGLRTDPYAMLKLMGWLPLLGYKQNGGIEEQLLRLVSNGDVVVRQGPRVGGGGGGGERDGGGDGAGSGHATPPGGHAKPAGGSGKTNTPAADDDAMVYPVISLDRSVAVVRRAHTRPYRRTVSLRADRPFDGKGVFTCSGENIAWYTSSTGDERVELSSGSLTIEGAVLTGSMTIYAEATAPSAALDDVLLSLRLEGGSKERGPQDDVTLTCVEVELEVVPAPGFADGGQPLSDEEKGSGMFLHVNRDTPDAHRATLTVKRARPHAFAGKLVLNVPTAGLNLYEELDDLTPLKQSAITFDNAALPPAGLCFTLEAITPGSRQITLGIEGVEAAADSLMLEVVRWRFSESPNQRNGYDDMDGDEGSWPHISVASSRSTVVQVDVDGTLRSNVFHVVDEAPNVARCEPPQVPRRQFDLPIVAGQYLQRAASKIDVHLYGPRGPRCARLEAHVYKTRSITLYLVRIEDPTSPGTRLSRPFYDVQDLEEAMNKYLKQAVVNVRVFEHNGGEPIPFVYDLDKSGVLKLLTFGKNPVLSFGRKDPWVVVIVAKILFGAPLARPALAGSDRLELPDASATARYKKEIEVTMPGDPAQAETLAVEHVIGATVITKTRLKKDHLLGSMAGFTVRGFSGSPLLCNGSGLPLAGMILAHEVMHNLGFGHVKPEDNLLNAGGTRLRYKPLTDHRKRNKSQWDDVPR